MLQFNRWQTGFILLIVAFGAYFTVPNFFPADKIPPGLPKSQLTLGLDLQGGSYLLLEVDTDKVLADRMSNLLGDIRTALRGASSGSRDRITYADLERQGNTITVRIRDEAEVDEALDRLRDLSQPLGAFGGLGRNIAIRNDGTLITLEMTPEAEQFYAANAVQDSIEVVRRRIDAMGTKEPLIQKSGENRLVVQVPGDSDSEALKNVINRTGQLSFHMVDPSVSLADAQRGLLPPRRIMLPTDDDPSPYLVLEENPLIPAVSGMRRARMSASALPSCSMSGSFPPR